MSGDDFPSSVPLPITPELDLHAFRPGEITRLLDDYFAECVRCRIRQVRVVHGKGTGAIRATVHAHLRRSRRVLRFAQGDESSGGWGATIVTLLVPGLPAARERTFRNETARPPRPGAAPSEPACG
jgi:DNA-nicking Smr family endonuclease